MLIYHVYMTNYPFHYDTSIIQVFIFYSFPIDDYLDTTIFVFTKHSHRPRMISVIVKLSIALSHVNITCLAPA